MVQSVWDATESALEPIEVSSNRLVPRSPIQPAPMPQQDIQDTTVILKQVLFGIMLA